MSFKDIEIIKNALDRPIILVGMMGAGKSHVGAALARSLGLEFIDSDKVVEQRAGCSVAEIFESFGEEKFREAEKNTILNLLTQPPQVIATGGGAITNDETLSHIKAQSLSVWLNPDMPLLMDRLSGKKQSRPLLQTDNPEDTIAALMQSRAGLYEQADINLEITSADQAQTLSRLIKKLSERLNTARF